jgi:hypothetical protein
MDTFRCISEFRSDGSLLRGDFDSSDPLSDLPSPTAARNWFLRETRGDRRGIAGGLSVCFRSKPLIVVRPKTLLRQVF